MESGEGFGGVGHSEVAKGGEVAEEGSEAALVHSVAFSEDEVLQLRSNARESFDRVVCMVVRLIAVPEKQSELLDAR